MKKKLAFVLSSTLMLSMFLIGCGNTNKEAGGESSDKPIVIKLGHVGPADTDHPWQKYVDVFAERVEKETDGKVKVESYPASQLGADREMLEGMQQGVVDAGLIGTIAMGNFVPEYQVWDLPYIFPNDQGKKDEIVNGPIGEEIAGYARDKGFEVISYWHHSNRSMSNSKRPIKSIDDLKGLKMRVVENPSSMDWFERIGAVPTPMAFNELYTALQQGVVDGQDNGPGLTYGSKFSEVQPYFTYTEHIYSVLAFIVSKKTWDKMPEDTQKIVKQLAQEVGKEQTKYSLEMEVKYGEMMEEAGVEIHRLSPDELKRLEESALPTYEKVGPQIGEELVNKMLEYKE
ncbi:TRAP transporter substrate-binding protein [Mesobacillus maritimus]|uniref:TRAP transporter substrate-binding protein n=1 Tax=Mesobacillus maritimus TaxID=1643336 RepID=UPI00203F53C4|nr:TRAP transporter substrate-binding protein [Mesobacillus maritimus]MCM3584978.1 TRAP transporter substrate-binding protein [Mesobacillus maritimus]